MRGFVELLGVLFAVTLVGQCCASPTSEATPQPAPAAGGTAHAPGAPTAEELPRLVFQVSGRYPASLVYALDRAAARVPDARYREWLFGAEPAKVPDWFSAYAAQRSTWETSRRGPDGPYDAYAACSHLADTIAALLDCAQQVLAPAQLAQARSALAEADALLRPRWAVLEPVLQRWQRELASITRGPQGSELARLLAQTARLPEDEQLTFEVVLVAKPRHELSRAQQAGAHLVVEVPDQREPTTQVDVLFHEIAHLAAKHAPGRAALERAFIGRGAAGVVAANLWNEAFATAFGNGLAAERLEPGLSTERAFYHDPAIDALGRALYQRWRAGAEITLDASLAEHLLQLVSSSWPRERWRVADVLRRLVVFSDDPEAAELSRQALRASSVYSYVPLPSELSVPAAAAPPVPRVILAALPSLRTRADILQLFGLQLAGVRKQLSAHGASLYWSDDDGGPALLLTAASAPQLRAATRALSALQQLPAPGWMSLRAVADTRL